MIQDQHSTSKKPNDPKLQMLVWNEIQEKSALGSVPLKATTLPAKEISRAPISLEIYSISFDVSAEPSFILNADVSEESLESIVKHLPKVEQQNMIHFILLMWSIHFMHLFKVSETFSVKST